jgi:hypothetical protein
VRRCIKEKTEQAEETREERAEREREAAGMRLLDTVGALERKEVIRQQHQISLLRQREFKREKIKAVSNPRRSQHS